MVMEGVYPVVLRQDNDRIRAAKAKASSEAQKVMNRIYSYQKLEFMLAANFVPGDLVVTVTYDDERYPGSRQQAKSQLHYFRRKMAKARAAAGEPFVCIWSTEHKHGDGRWHHHMVINATATRNDYEQIRKMWIYGDNIEIEPLRVDGDKNYETLARYMTKEIPDKPGQRTWCASRNCQKPEVETFRVEGDTQLHVPKGAMMLGQSADKVPGAGTQIVKYIDVDGLNKRRKKSPRRK